MLTMLSNPAFTAGSPFTVTRTAEGSRPNGRYTPGSASTFPIIASVQPVSGRELMILPEAQHVEEVRVVYTATEIKTREPGYEPDKVTIDGAAWTVIRAERWTYGAETYWRALVSRRAP
jgi:hypothetical protein